MRSAPRRSGRELGLGEDRCYGSFEDMARREARLKDGIEAGRHRHAEPHALPVAKAFLQRGIHVICDKPLTATLKEARKLVELVEKSGRVFALTHNYTGYPMVRHARQMVADGELGEIRLINAAYIQDWLTDPIEQGGQKQAEWRTDPARSGVGGRSATSARTPTTLPVSSRGWSRKAWPPTSPVSSLAVSWTTIATSCCATRTARAGRSGRARWRPATRTA
jgi:hypothetical protein